MTFARLLTISGFALLLTMCQQPIAQEDLIAEAVEIKIDQWKAEQIRICYEQAVIKAEAHVDSILIAQSLETKLDTIPKPSKPIKPYKPSFKEKPDSVVVNPVLKKDEY
jgi:hypothetical protein